MENIQDIYPLSPMQEGMLFHSISSPESEVYQEQFSCSLIGKLDVNAFKSAWDLVIQKHDILRTAFIWEDVEEPLQVVHESVDLPFELINLEDKDESNQKIFIQEKLVQNIKIPLEINDAPLMKVTLIKLNNDEYFLIWDHHHILFDGWGLPLLIQEIMSNYHSIANKISIEHTNVFPYKNYIEWLKNQDEETAKLFWNERLKELRKGTNLKLPFSKDSKPGYIKNRYHFSKTCSENIITLAKKEQFTLNSFLQAVWALVLSYYIGDDDVVFGATVSGRNADVPGIESMIGLFINTLPVRAKIDKNQIALEWLKEFQLQQSELQSYEYSPLFKIQQWSEIPKGEALFNSIFVFENYPVSETLDESDAELQIQNVNSVEKTNYPLTIAVSPGKQLAVEMAFDTTEFDSDGIDQIFKRMEIVTESLLANIDKPINEINYISDIEIISLEQISSGEKRQLEYSNVVSWFEEIVKSNTELDAVVSDEGSISFNELNKKANQFAITLVNKNIGRGSIVGISLERSIDMVVSLLGVMKTGAVVLPIDTAYPEARIKHILNDSKMDMLIASKQVSAKLVEENIKIIDIEYLNDNSRNVDHENLGSEILGNDLSYIIYTSGSTGKPKGVCLEHYSLCNFANYSIIDFGFGDNEKILQFSSFGFDAAIGEIFSSLLSGGTLYIPKREVTLSVDDLADYINDNQISFAYLPPSFLSVITPDEFSTNLKIVSVGDKCTTTLAKIWGEKFSFFNGYGPTETTIGATFLKYESNLNNLSTMPIGKGFSNVDIYILDERLNQVAVGVKGEIFISGDGVGRGYLNNPVATTEKFIPDPFSNIPGKRMYRTGDIARLLPDGNLEFIGRRDFQVKLRGYRIELNEIEVILHKHEEVKDSVVVALKEENGNEYLAAYVIPENGFDNHDLLLGFMSKELPEFMIPKSIMFMDEFPLTTNNKIDKEKLPKPSIKDAAKEFEKPVTTTEEVIANIWSDILKVEKISRNSNFFELGGHSLLATQLISRLRETFKKEIPFQVVFESKDLEEISNRIDTEELDQTVKENIIKKADRTKNLPLSYSQQRLWFLDQLKPNDVSYNIPTVMRLKGEIKTELFEDSLNLIIKKHEVLRTSFGEENGKPFQMIANDYKINVTINEVDGNSADEKIEKIKVEIQNEVLIPFKLSELPLIRCKIYRISEDEIILFVLTHHIISDGWSISIVIKEFVENYSILSQDKKMEQRELDVQFADYAAWQQTNFESDEYHQQLEYWREKLQDAPPLLELPYDKPKPSIQTNNSGKVSLIIETEKVDELLSITRSENATLFMTMMAGFQILLSKYSNVNDIVVGTPIAGRNNSQIEKLIGFFVNNLAIRGEIDVKETFREFLIQIRDTTLSAFGNQSLPFDKLVEELQPVRDLSHQPIFQTMFVFQNIPFDSDKLNDFEILPFDIDSETTSYDLTLTLNQTEKGIEGIFDYNSDLFEESSIARFAQNYNLLLSQITSDPDIDIEDLKMLSGDDKELVLNEWNRNEVKEKIVDTVVERFEKTVENNFNNEALVFATNETTSLRFTYRELNKKINQLSRYLVQNNIQLEDRVAICMDRHHDMIISMFAILKSGAAFVPIDPSLPLDRIQYMIENSGSKAVIINNSSKDIFESNDAKIINLDEVSDEIQNMDDSNLKTEIELDNLAYIIFTSGSTGLPKGTMLHHVGLTNLSIVQKEAFEISNNKKVMQFSSLSFDASVWETVMALLNGGALYLTTKEVISSGHELHKYLNKNEISTITLPPSVLAVLPKENLPNLKTLITAGEAVSNELVEEWNTDRDYFNAYGPTETTVCATMLNVKESYPKGPPIGKAIDNFETYILDRQLHPVGIGIPGELCVGGIGLARGYIGQSELTAEKFIPNLFSSERGKRLYRTGDLAKYLPNGEIEFLGRIDTQVKIRGFRIEIGEIENNLKQIDYIKDAVVISKTSGDLKDKLIAYIICNENEYDKDKIVDSLKNRLPDYMLPNIFMRLDSMPLNTSGKVNKNALPSPEYSREELGTEYIAPRNDEENKLVVIVQDLLKIDKVGIKDNFFELGGHSLLATQFISRIREDFGTEIKLIKLFEDPTIEGVLKNIKVSANEPKIERPKIAKVSRESRRTRRTDIS